MCVCARKWGLDLTKVRVSFILMTDGTDVIIDRQIFFVPSLFLAQFLSNIKVRPVELKLQSRIKARDQNWLVSYELVVRAVPCYQNA